MNIEHFHKKLLKKESELVESLARFESEVRLAGEPEVRDSIDDATISQGTSEVFEEATVFASTLEEVRDALQRIEKGNYGVCTLCGEKIETARLEAVPWAPYCLADQEKQDARSKAL